MPHQGLATDWDRRSRVAGDAAGASTLAARRFPLRGAGQEQGGGSTGVPSSGAAFPCDRGSRAAPSLAHSRKGKTTNARAPAGDVPIAARAGALRRARSFQRSVGVPWGLTDFTGLAKAVKPTTNSTTSPPAITATGTLQTGRRRGSHRFGRRPTSATCSDAFRGFSMALVRYRKSAMRQPIVFVTDFGRDDAYAAALIGTLPGASNPSRSLSGRDPRDSSRRCPCRRHLSLRAGAGIHQREAVFCAVVGPGRRHRAAGDRHQGRQGRVRCSDNGLVSYLWDGRPRRPLGGACIGIGAMHRRPFTGATCSRPLPQALSSGDSISPAISSMADGLADAFARRDGARSHPAQAGRGVDHFGNAITTIPRRGHRWRKVRAVTWPGGESRGPGRHLRADRRGWSADRQASHLEVAGRGIAAAAVGGPHAGDAVESRLG